MIDKYRLEIILFVSGAVLMILGLVGSRIVAPYLGTSIHVWTSLISIILAGLSLGYALGGRLADRTPGYGVFSLLILLAALLVGTVCLVREPLLGEIQDRVADIRIAAVMAAALLLAPPSVILGMLPPYAVRLRIKAVNQSGTTVGRLYAFSTGGSIAGTFLAGFFLIAFFGCGNLLRLLAMILLLTSFLACTAKASRYHWAASAILVLGLLWSWWQDGMADSLHIVDADTRYNRVIVEERLDNETGSYVRHLRVGRGWGQSAVVVGRPETLYYLYNRFFRLADHFAPDNRRALLIGGGACTVARDYLARHPDGRIDVVEIDPALVRLGKTHFYLTDDPRMKMFYEDGRAFLNHTQGTYDVIFMDIFTSTASAPFHLITREALQGLADHLTPGGLVMANLYSAIDGLTGRFLRAALATFRQVFDHVAVFPVRHPKDGRQVQNLVLAAFRSGDPPNFSSPDVELSGYLAHRWKKEIPLDVPMLTDDFAPVDHYLIPRME